MTLMQETIAAVGPLDEAAAQAARAREDELTKPQGSLGRLETLASQIAGITGTPRPRLRHRAIVVMAADHGVAAEHVSAYPQQVTLEMVRNFLRGGAAINVLARAASARVVVVDMGVIEPLPAHPALVVRRVAAGTQNMMRGPAMTRKQAMQAIEAGIEVLYAEADRGLDIVATGDMGIGNTTAASAIVAVLTGRAVAAVTGRGTGIDDAALAAKVAVVQTALRVNQPNAADPLDVISKVGGFEIAGLAGVALAAAARRIPVLVDGFISGAAALVAVSLCPGARPYLIAAHQSAELGHRAVLESLGLTPLLDLGLRLGEGSGAAVALPVVDASVRTLDEMATFTEATVSQKTDATPARPA
jgi:nicotinate-nucleotide--dimethylbenzimidazole phosphoribosyltransferase